MVCDKGSNERKINLPQSHGSYVKDKPMMSKVDNVVEKNIKFFGICSGECPSGNGDIAVIDIKIINETNEHGKLFLKCLLEGYMMN